MSAQFYASRSGAWTIISLGVGVALGIVLSDAIATTLGVVLAAAGVFSALGVACFAYFVPAPPPDRPGGSILIGGDVGAGAAVGHGSVVNNSTVINQAPAPVIREVSRRRTDGPGGIASWDIEIEVQADALSGRPFRIQLSHPELRTMRLMSGAPNQRQFAIEDGCGRVEFTVGTSGRYRITASAASQAEPQVRAGFV